MQERDIAAGAVAMTSERRRVVNFTQSFMTMRSAAVLLKPSAPVDTSATSSEHSRRRQSCELTLRRRRCRLTRATAARHETTTMSAVYVGSCATRANTDCRHDGPILRPVTCRHSVSCLSGHLCVQTAKRLTTD